MEHELLDAAVQLIRVALLSALVALNFGLSKQIKAIEEKLGRY